MTNAYSHALGWEVLTRVQKPAGFCELAPLKSALCSLLKGPKPPSKTSALVGSPLKSSAVTVHLGYTYVAAVSEC